MSNSSYKKMMLEDLGVDEELSKIGREQHLGWLNKQHKKYEDEIKRYIKALNNTGEKKMAMELMKLYKKHLIEFKIGLEKIYKG